MNFAEPSASAGKRLRGTAFNLDSASASSLSSAGKWLSLYCHLLTMRLHPISRAMLFIPAAVDLKVRASLSAPILSPLIKAPVVESTSSKVTATMKSVRYSKEV